MTPRVTQWAEELMQSLEISTTPYYEYDSIAHKRDIARLEQALRQAIEAAIVILRQNDVKGIGPHPAEEAIRRELLGEKSTP